MLHIYGVHVMDFRENFPQPLNSLLDQHESGCLEECGNEDCNGVLTPLKLGPEISYD